MFPPPLGMCVFEIYLFIYFVSVSLVYNKFEKHSGIISLKNVLQLLLPPSYASPLDSKYLCIRPLDIILKLMLINFNFLSFLYFVLVSFNLFIFGFTKFSFAVYMMLITHSRFLVLLLCVFLFFAFFLYLLTHFVLLYLLNIWRYLL